MKYRELKEHYLENKDEIEERLEEFRETGDSGDKRLFKELVFVILTSQTEAQKAWKATQEMDEKDLLLAGNREQIVEVLKRNGVQYENDKASYIVENRKFLSQPTLSNPAKELKLKEKIDKEDLEKSRDWLVENLKGIGMKGASHFLRNIGHGNGFAIISGHLLDKMFELGIIDSNEPPSNREEYRAIEQNFREFSQEIGISAPALDLAIWSMETGEVFK